jgi:hypothetical protein
VLTALNFVLTLEEPSRFAKSRMIGAYLGLVSATSTLTKMAFSWKSSFLELGSRKLSCHF